MRFSIWRSIKLLATEALCFCGVVALMDWTWAEIVWESGDSDVAKTFVGFVQTSIRQHIRKSLNRRQFSREPRNIAWWESRELFEDRPMVISSTRILWVVFVRFFIINSSNEISISGHWFDNQRRKRIWQFRKTDWNFSYLWAFLLGTQKTPSIWSWFINSCRLVDRWTWAHKFKLLQRKISQEFHQWQHYDWLHWTNQYVASKKPTSGSPAKRKRSRIAWNERKGQIKTFLLLPEFFEQILLNYMNFDLHVDIFF